MTDMGTPRATLHLSDCPESIQQLVRTVAEQFQESVSWPTGNRFHLLRENQQVPENDFNAFGHSAFEFHFENGLQTVRLNLWALFDTGRFARLFDESRGIIDRAFTTIRDTEQPVVFTRDDIARFLRRSVSDHYMSEVEYLFSRTLYNFQSHPDHGWQIAVDVQRTKNPTPSIEVLFLQRPTLPSSVAATELLMSRSIFSDGTEFSMNKKVFIVHGRDAGTKNTVARYIEKIKLIPIILHEQASKGRTIPEKIEEHSDVGFAVVLLTPDDVGKKKGATTRAKDRARQNVILELGYFWGRLGRSRVCALVKGKIEHPSDYDNVVYEELDEAGAWKVALAKELREAGYDVDLNAIA